MTDLITLADFKSYLGPAAKKSSQADAELSAHVAAASDWVRDEINRDFDQRVYTEVIDGNGQDVIQLRHEPVSLVVPVVVSENGIALVTSFGYSTIADVIVKPGTNAPNESAYLVRLRGPTMGTSPGTSFGAVWPLGPQNITVIYTAGYDASSMPPAIKALTKYIAARFWKESDRKEIGISRRSTGGRSVDFAKDIPEPYQSIIKNWNKWT